MLFNKRLLWREVTYSLKYMYPDDLTIEYALLSPMPSRSVPSTSLLASSLYLLLASGMACWTTALQADLHAGGYFFKLYSICRKHDKNLWIG